jgi:DNA-binding NarL/FixJ family response regulator
MIQSTADKAMQHTSIEVLSRYETELIKFISNGMTSKQIGQQLNISYRTISTHRYKLMKKLDAKNMAELVRFASPNGIAIKE